MLRSVFTVGRGRLAVAFEGGEVLETGAQDSVGQQQTYTVHHLSREIVEQGQTKTMTASNAVDLAYSADASMLAVVTEDKRVWVWRRTSSGDEIKKRERPLSTPEEKGETEPQEKRQELLGWRELPKKPTSVTFAPAAAGDRYSGSEKGEVLVIADKCGDAHAAPLPDPSLALKHLLGHTAMTITAMVSLREGSLLATADRAEHIRVSQFPRTSIVHTYLLGHTDFVSALAPVPGENSLLLSGGGDGMVGLWDVERGEKLAMISVRKACQGLAEGDEPASVALGTSHYTAGDVLSKGAARMNLEEMVEREQGMEDGRIGANGGGGSCDVKTSERRNNVEERCGNGTEFRRGGGSTRGEDGDRGTEKGAEGEGAAEGRGVDEDGQEGGVPLSIACSEDGKTVAVAVGGLKGLLLLTLSRGGGPGNRAVGLVPRARLQFPTVPIQAGFLDDDLIVALPSASSDEFLQAFRLTEGGDGAILANDGTSTAQAKCLAITSAARKQALHRDGGYVLKAAVPDEDASEALGGGLRKHKGTRNGGKSSSSDWNNFSKRRDKKLDRKRRRTVMTQSSVVIGEPKAQPPPRTEAAPSVVLP